MNNGGKLKCQIEMELVLTAVEVVNQVERKEIVSKMYKCQNCKNIFEEYYPLCPICRSPKVYEEDEEHNQREF